MRRAAGIGGNDFNDMTRIVVGAQMPRPDNRSDSACQREGVLTTRDNSQARSCLRDEINESGVPRKAFADLVASGDESLFSKMVAGGRPFDLADFDNLPRELRVKWMQRYGREVLGVQVREMEPAELNAELLALVERIAAVHRLAQSVGKPQPAKASMRGQEEKRAASW